VRLASSIGISRSSLPRSVSGVTPDLQVANACSAGAPLSRQARNKVRVAGSITQGVMPDRVLDDNRLKVRSAEPRQGRHDARGA
jgi:hypothetical protein